MQIGKLRKVSKVTPYVGQLGVSPSLSAHKSWAGHRSAALRQEVAVGTGV